jgi:CHAT domain-containing protein/tetratricopeptide (TPR) repeat protein
MASRTKLEGDQVAQFREAAALLYQQGRYAEAIELAMAAVQLGIREHGQGDPSVAENFGFLGLIYKASGTYDRAEDCYRYAIDVLRSAKGDDAIELATHLNNLGVLYKIQRKFADAAALYKEALRLRRLHFGEQSFEVVNTRSNIGALLEATGDEGAALAEYMQAMILARGLGEDGRPAVTNLLNNVGNIYGRRKQWNQAEPLLREALERSTRDNGATHPTTAQAQLNLGEVVLRQGRPNEAGELFADALTSLQAALGDTHERVVLAKASLFEAIKELSWKLDTEGSSLDPGSAQTLHEKLTTFRRVYESADSETRTEDSAQDSGAPTNAGSELAIDISQVDEPLRAGFLEAVDFLVKTGRQAQIQRLVNEHPQLRAVLEPIVNQVRAIQEKAMGVGVPELLGAIGDATDIDERVALCRKALLLVSREQRPDIWFSVRWTLAASLSESKLGAEAQRLEDAIAALLEALSVDRKSVPPSEWASALSSLGSMYRRRVHGDAAENIEHAIEAYEAALAMPEHRAQTHLFASTQNNLANAYAVRTRGDRDENLSRSVSLLEHVLGVTSRDAMPDEWARAQNNLGAACLNFQLRDVESNRERAIEALRQALTIRTREYAPQKWAETMVNLANAWRRRLAGARRQNLAEARTCYENALQIWTRESDAENYFKTLNALAVACLEDRDAAEFSLGPSLINPELLIPLTDEELTTMASDYPVLTELLEARRAGADHVTLSAPRRAQLTRSICTLCLIERAADRRRYLALHPELATGDAEAVIASNQALIGTDGSGDWGEATVALLEESRLLARWRSIGLDSALSERIQFEELEDRASQLAASLWTLAPGSVEGAGLIAEAVQADDAVLARLGDVGTELQRHRFLPRMTARMTTILSAILSRQIQDPGLRGLGANLILRRKKIEGELWSRLRDGAARSESEAASRKYGELLLTRRQIAQRILAVAEEEDGSEFRRHLLDLRVREEQLEIELAELVPVADLGARVAPVDSDAVSAAMPGASALVEFLRLPLSLTGEDTASTSRYVAAVFVADKPGYPSLIDLGAAEEIDALVAETRYAVTGAPDRRATGADSPDGSTGRRPFSEVATELRSRVFDPVREALAGAEIVYLSPDGDLARLPFAILPTSGAGYLIDKYEFRYVGTGRDLLRFGLRVPRTFARSLVIADPDFELEGVGESPSRVFFFEDLFGGVSGLASPEDRPLERPDLRFGPLKWGRDEGETVAKLLGVKPLVGKSAVKQTLMKCRSPQILHLATHGIFLEDEEGRAPSRDESAAHRLGMRIVPRHEDPLMRSWLLFAGANQWLHRKPVPDAAGNCVITAMEAATMSLENTELVALSACESGLGVIQVGEGVLGLRRGFAIAGAQTVIMTLWEVPDRYARDIFVGFYERALRGSKGRAAALREAQLEVKKARPDPYFWGAVVCEGEPGPLSATKSGRPGAQRSASM